MISFNLKFFFSEYKFCISFVKCTPYIYIVLHVYCIVLFYFILTTAVWYVGVLAPQPGIKPGPPTVEAWSLNQWTAREVPYFIIFNECYYALFVHNQSFLSCLFQNFLFGFQHFYYDVSECVSLYIDLI